MDKVILNKQQLGFLKDFIRRRGFVEPVQIQEILDHFACKVEELMMQNRSLSFDKALIDAHASFGVMGFRPIVKALNDVLENKYKHLYWQTARSSLLSVKWLPIIIGFGLVGYKFMQWTELSGWNAKLQMNVTANFLFVLLIVSRITLFLKTGGFRKRENNYHIRFTNMLFDILPFALTVNIFSYSPVSHLKIACLLMSLLYSYFVISLIASRKSIESAMKDHDEFLKFEE